MPSVPGVPMLARRHCAVLLLLSWIASISIAAGPQAKRITGIYSNMSYSQQSGDLVGMELLIIPSGKGPEPEYSAVVQIADGGPPIVAVTRIELSGSKIEFTLPSGGDYGGQHYVGVFDGADLVVRSGQNQEERLKKGRSYWQ
jgi:hypothetical protein